MVVRLTTYDRAEDLTSDVAIATFVAEALATEDPGYIAQHGNPTLKTTIAVMKALGIELTTKVPV
jgi:DNA-binding phage protein